MILSLRSKFSLSEVRRKGEEEKRRKYLYLRTWPVLVSARMSHAAPQCSEVGVSEVMQLSWATATARGSRGLSAVWDLAWLIILRHVSSAHMWLRCSLSAHGGRVGVIALRGIGAPPSHTPKFE